MCFLGFFFFQSLFNMEVLQPTIICIGNRRYRKYPIGSPGEVKVAHDELPGKMKSKKCYYKITLWLNEFNVCRVMSGIVTIHTKYRRNTKLHITAKATCNQFALVTLKKTWIIFLCSTSPEIQNFILF